MPTASKVDAEKSRLIFYIGIYISPPKEHTKRKKKCSNIYSKKILTAFRHSYLKLEGKHTK